jgi:PTS system N-acetylgalactosamine-specific IIA component
MAGMIVTGHGSFASGITSGLKLLAGELKNYRAVDFTEDDSSETLAKRLKEAVNQLKECEGIVIFADLTGGSPFNESIKMKMENLEKLEVIGGANLPAVLDCYMTRMMQDETETLARASLEAGKHAMVLFEQSGNTEDEYEE